MDVAVRNTVLRSSLLSLLHRKRDGKPLVDKQGTLNELLVDGTSPNDVGITTPRIRELPSFGDLSFYHLTPGGALIHTVSLDEHVPETTNKLLLSADSELMRYLSDPSRGTPVVATGRNSKGTNFQNLKDVFLTWCASRTQPIKTEDIEALSPKDALVMAAQVVQDLLQYRDITAGNPSSDPRNTSWFVTFERMMKEVLKPFKGAVEIAQAVPDALVVGVEVKLESPDKMLANQQSFHEVVCRHYAHATASVFELLKRMQNSETTQLRNSYVQVISGAEHAWNAIYTIEPNGTVLTTGFDPTWNDTGVRGSTKALDYAEVADRDFFRQLALLRGTGNREVRLLKSQFGCTFGKLTLEHVMGRLDCLSDAFDRLPEAARPEAMASMNGSLQEALNAFREEHQLPQYSSDRDLPIGGARLSTDSFERSPKRWTFKRR